MDWFKFSRTDRIVAFCLIISLIVLLSVLTSGCGGWLNETRGGLLAANAAVNAYDDVAVEVWKDAPSKPELKEQLGISLCATVIVQDAVVQSWEITAAVDAGIAKKQDITPYIRAAITALDSLEDYLTMGGVAVPPVVTMAIDYLEQINPGGVLPPGTDPLEQCTIILTERFSSETAGVPWSTIISAGSEFVLFLLEVLKEEDIPYNALSKQVREPFKQAILYRGTAADVSSPSPDEEGP